MSVKTHSILLTSFIVATALNNACSQETVHPCFDVYCLVDSFDEFQDFIPDGADYEVAHIALGTIFDVKQPFIINGQNFEIEYIDHDKENIQELSAKYSYTPRKLGDCVNRYAQLLDYALDEGVDTQPNTDFGSKYVESERRETPKGVSFVLWKLKPSEGQSAFNVSARDDLRHKVFVRMSNSVDTDYETCRLSIGYRLDQD